MRRSAMYDDQRQRIAVLPVHHIYMERLLRLPEGFEVRGSHPMFDRDAVGFLLRSPSFEVVPEGVEAPECEIEMHSCPTCRGPIFDNLVYPARPGMARVTDWTCLPPNATDPPETAR